MDYLNDHWCGRHSLSRSMLLNGLAAYVGFLAVAMGLARLGDSALALSVYALIFAAWTIWATVGSIRSAVKVVASSDASFAKRTLAIISIAMVAGVFYLTVVDISHL